MKENVKDFNDKTKYIKLSEINDMMKGFIESKILIQKHIIETIKN